MEASETTRTTGTGQHRTGVPRDTKSESVWQQGIEQLEYTRADEFDPAKIYDVLIVGGGITGLTTACLLQAAGKNCVLAEAYTLGYGTTGGTTAHLNTYLDTTYDQIEKDFGKDNAKLVAEASKAAISLVEQNVIVHQIKCNFEYRPGFLYAETDEEAAQLEKIFHASVDAGVSVHIADTLPAPIPIKSAIVFEGQAQIHPLKYIYGLAKEFVKQGGIILERSPITAHEKSENYYRASSQAYTINASQIIYATHIPPGINLLHFRNAPYRSYAMALRLPEDLYPDALIYDLKDPYHYIRSEEVEGEKYLIVGGADHKTGHGSPSESYKSLEEFAKFYYRGAEVAYSWSAQYYQPSDGLPYIGKLPGGDEGIFVATGYSGNGITYGSIAGKILSDLVQGIDNKYEKVFSPARIKPIAGFTEFVKENVDVAYKFIADRVSAKEIQSLHEIGYDSAAVVEFKDHKLAIYRDAAGTLHALNPVCTHAKCIVNWNDAEKSWDCPCHGARYDIGGDVLNGPARQALQRVDIHDLFAPGTGEQ